MKDEIEYKKDESIYAWGHVFSCPENCGCTDICKYQETEYENWVNDEDEDDVK